MSGYSKFGPHIRCEIAASERSRNADDVEAELQRGHEGTNRIGSDQGAEEDSGNRIALQRASQPGDDLEEAGRGRGPGTSKPITEKPHLQIAVP